MKKIVAIFSIFGALLFFTGCISSGPTEPQALAHAVRSTLPADVASPIIIAEGSWFPNSQGYGALKSITLTAQAGVIAITEKQIVFLQWSSSQQRFNIMRIVPFLESKQVFLDKLGVGRMLVIQNKDYSFDTFEFDKASGFLVDSESTEKAYLFIQAERQKFGQRP